MTPDQVEAVARVGEADVAQDDIRRLVLDQRARRAHVASGTDHADVR
jgi:hypothetical protein